MEQAIPRRNDEIRMTKETRMTKPEMLDPAAFASFVIWNSFVIRHSDFIILLSRVIDFLAQHIHGIHDPDDYRIHWRILEVRRKARGTALAKHH